MDTGVKDLGLFIVSGLILLAASPTAFTLIKNCGAAYIVIMGVMMLRRGKPAQTSAALSLPSYLKRMAGGAFVFMGMRLALN